MQKLQHTVLVSDVSVHLHPLKRSISKEIQSLTDLGKLRLKPSNKHEIIDFVSPIPKMTSNAVTRNNIIHGGLENGTIDINL